MSFVLPTIDLPERLFRVVGGSFRLMPEGELSQGWDATPRGGVPRFERWTAEVDLAAFHKGADGDLRFEWEVFIARLHGVSTAFRLHDPLRVLPRGQGAGIYNPRHPNGRRNQGDYAISGGYLIDGSHGIDGGSTYAYVASDAARYADTLHVSGLVPSVTAFKPGDHISTGGNLYMVMDEAVADADGEASLLIAWRLWRPALAGDRVDLYKPTGRFVLRAIDEGTMSRSFASGQASLQAVEVPYVD